MNQFGIRMRRKVAARVPGDRRRGFFQSFRLAVAKLRASRGSQRMHWLELDRPKVDPVIGRRQCRKARKQLRRLGVRA